MTLRRQGSLGPKNRVLQTELILYIVLSWKYYHVLISTYLSISLKMLAKWLALSVSWSRQIFPRNIDTCVYNFYVESKMEVPNSSLNLFLGSVEILSFIVTNCIEVFLELLKYGMRQHDTCKVSIHDPLHFSIFPTAVRLLSLLSFCIAFLPPFAPA